MLNSKKQKVVFFGCPLDCDEKHDAIEEKQAGAAFSGTTDDPLDNVMDLIRQEVPAELWEAKGSYIGTRPGCDHCRKARLD